MTSSRKKKRLRVIGCLVGLPLILAGLYLWAVWLVGDSIRETHTRFALGQVGYVIRDSPRIATIEELTQLLSKEEKLDWNSCSLVDDGILDGWDQPMEIVSLESGMRWSFRSAGCDQMFGTDDDIVYLIDWSSR